MLTLWRRHGKGCIHTNRQFLKCKCPIWLDWRVAGKRIRKPLGLRDWGLAQQRARQMEAEGIGSAGQVVTVRKATGGLRERCQEPHQEHDPSAVQEFVPSI